MNNQHFTAIPADIVEQVKKLLHDGNEILLPYIKSLTPDERRTIAKIGEKSLSFVEKAHQAAVENPNLVPPYLNMKEFDTDFEDAHNLWSLLLVSQQIHQNIDDTTMVAGSEAYQSSLVFYNSVKMAARQDIAGAKAIYEELKKRFPRHKFQKESEIETEPESENID
jgi:hypothetical protein